MIIINLNDMVEVVLTEVGAEALNDYHTEIAKSLKGISYKEYKEGDTYRTQLWDAINIFKYEIGLGQKSPFENCSIYL